MSLKFTLILCFIFSVHADLSKYSYYPQSLLELIEDHQEKKLEALLKQELFHTLNGLHEISSYGPDRIVKRCSKGKSCYSQVRTISYKQARRHLFGDIYLKKNSFGDYYVTDRYCLKKYDRKAGVGPGKIPSHQKVNCEHTWPQSRFSKSFSKSLQKSDLHHLFPVNSRANSTRGNIIFGEVIGDVVSDECRASYRGVIDYKNSRSKAFTPPKSHRGNVARSIFYFSIRYQLPITQDEEYYLRRWHREDPVDTEEVNAHQKIFKIQNNRNPFIDQPELVSMISNF